MGSASQAATIFLIVLFTLDVFTDVATGIELILNDKPFCELNQLDANFRLTSNTGSPSLTVDSWLTHKQLGNGN